MIIDCALYENGHRVNTEPIPLEDISEDLVQGRDNAFLWLGMHEPTHDELGIVSEELHLHELAVEDAVHASQRPKIEVYDGSLFMVFKTTQYDDVKESVRLGELLVFIGPWYIVVVRHGEAAELKTVRAALEATPERLAGGPGVVLYAICDRVVDAYAPVIDKLWDDAGEVELVVFSEAREDPIERIYNLKRQVLKLWRAVFPLLEVLQALKTEELPGVRRQERTYFRDVFDHVYRAFEETVQLRDMLTSVLEADLARIGVRQNEDMRKISAWVAIFVVPTLVAGIYGMNFENMPELRSRYGYYFVLGFMVALCTLLYAFFRRAKWL